MANTVISMEKIKDFFNSQVYDEDKWALNIVNTSLPPSPTFVLPTFIDACINLCRYFFIFFCVGIASLIAVEFHFLLNETS